MCGGVCTLTVVVKAVTLTLYAYTCGEVRQMEDHPCEPDGNRIVGIQAKEVYPRNVLDHHIGANIDLSRL